jgi:hypothetical protein
VRLLAGEGGGSSAARDPNTAHWLKYELQRIAASAQRDLPIAKRADPSPDELWAIYKDASGPPDHLREQLARHHMVFLADLLEGWALDKGMTPERSAKFIGFAEGVRALADEVGPDWNPPPPKTLCFVAYLARKRLGE